MGLAGPRHRAQIRQLLGFRETTVADAMALGQWLEEQVLPQERAYQPVLAAVLLSSKASSGGASVHCAINSSGSQARFIK